MTTTLPNLRLVCGATHHAMATTTYVHVAMGTPLWRRDKEFEIAGVPIMSS